MLAMKWLALLLVCESARALQPLPRYHEAEGIPAMQRIQRHEKALNITLNSRFGSLQRAHPYLGGLIISLIDCNMSMCGASLISNTKAVTAAHCWWDGRSHARHFTVVYGSDYLTTGGVRFITNMVESHVGFNPNTYANDIAMITHPRVTYDEHINRIPIDTSASTVTYENTWATAAGYGPIRNDPFMQSGFTKKEARVEVITLDVCRRSWSATVLPSSVMCGRSAGSADICAGDSGGPVVSGFGNSRVLIGIMSVGTSASCGTNIPFLSRRVNFWASWINSRL